MRFETKTVHVGEEFEKSKYGDVIKPIHVSSTFGREEVDKLPSGYEYSRTGNPTRHALEERLAALDGGAGALAFASGLAA